MTAGEFTRYLSCLLIVRYLQCVLSCLPVEINNGVKKDFASKDATRFWVNDDVKVQQFSHPLVSVFYKIIKGK